MINDSNKKEHVALDSLIDKDKNSLKLEVFESSMIRTEILENQMVRGEQLWVYHDGGTDPSNIMARKKITNIVKPAPFEAFRACEVFVKL